MELRDLIVTPLVIMLVYAVAYMIRPRVTDAITRRYFFPALTLKIIGALAVGFIYQFYYDGGDTFNFHTHGSRIIWNAFMDSPVTGLKLLFANGEMNGETYRYASSIPFFHDQSSYFVIRVAAFFDLFTFSSYSATAVLFAVAGFAGVWLLFKTFYDMYPQLHGWIAVACFFIPSVFFWGSGLLKDTLTLAALGMFIYAAKKLLISYQVTLRSISLMVVSFMMLFIVKIYILLCLLPAVLLWIHAERLFRIKSIMAKALLIPIVLVVIAVSGYLAVLKVGENDPRYSLDQIARTAQITAYDIGFYTGRDAGSGYSIGELDGSYQSMLMLAPSAINVSLFRPYLWEVNGPLMILSSLESLVLLGLVVVALLKNGFLFFRAWGEPNVLFCMIFSIVFAFAVGVSTFNFGTLSRYKIPLLPFFFIGITLIINYQTNVRRSEKYFLDMPHPPKA